MNILKPIVISMGLSIACLTQAQQLSLFQGVESNSQADFRAAAVARSESGQSNNQPEFILRGTSKFGDKYRASLVNKNGSVVTVTWLSGQTSEIVGFPGYSVIGIASRSAVIRLPANQTCIPSAVQGVSCTEVDRVANLALVLSKALREPGSTPDKQEGDITLPRSGSDFDSNPDELNQVFSALNEVDSELSQDQKLAVAARLQRRTEHRSMRNARRISDVPVGMTLVRTPLGDRLIPSP